MEAQLVRKAVNRCAAQGKPFLFGVDFELREGFFVENPLVCRQIPFACGEITNVPDSFSGEAEITPRLEILHTDREAYLRRFAVIRRGLLRGDSFLTNLTERTPIRTNLTLEEIFRRSCARYKLLLPGRLVCFSPECFVRITDGVIRSYPMKGTIDAALPDAEARLLEDYKERCEHYTIVDLIRNDLNRIADRVRVERFRYVEKIATLRGEILQTSSEIAGDLRSGWRQELGDLLFSLLPAGSISGAPKPATLRLIRDAEQCPRGYYTGGIRLFRRSRSGQRGDDPLYRMREWAVLFPQRRRHHRAQRPPAGVRRGRYQNLPADSLIAMDELLFIETIRVEDGTFVRPELHLQRMRQTVREAYGVASGFDLADGSIPLQHRKGTVKCRIVYGRSLSEISFAPYVPREIRSLRLVAADDELDYHLKYADRSALARLLQRRDDCDEILIVRDGAITDTSYSNVAFFDGRKYVTPDTFLLNGTRRQYLLGTGVLTECRITPSDLGGFERVVLINAMLGIEDDLAVPIERIRGL